MSLWQAPAIVVVFLTWLLSPPTGFADAAAHEAVWRALLPKAARSLTNQDVAGMPSRPSPSPPPSSAELSGSNPTPTSPDAAKKAVETHDADWWGTRIAAARAARERDLLVAESLQSRVNALTNEASARDDPAWRRQLYEQRARVLAELDQMKEKIAADQTAIDAIQEDARTLKVPAGWLR
jgi:hypothetical protein